MTCDKFCVAYFADSLSMFEHSTHISHDQHCRDYRPIPHLDVYDTTELADDRERVRNLSAVCDLHAKCPLILG